MEEDTGRKWLPLEANPDVMNDFARRLGAPPSAAFHDVFGLDPDLLAMVPQPVRAVLLLFPITEQSDAADADEIKDLAASSAGAGAGQSVYFLRQTVGNACGTIGLLHALLNNAEAVPPGHGSYLERFKEKTAAMSPMERAHFLEEDQELEGAHESAASTGDTQAPDRHDPVNLHFVCFVEKQGTLYELDGRKPFPIPHGPSSPSTLLQDSAKVVQKSIARSSDALNFNVIALGGANEDM
ncbi:Ubiquitin C-terminal hydrolase [Klebsormidium nitens]|uniref:Ubiquitin carboxyl-terminal hydrolase n=1 Tax=Klebsormidium nitens TaxID=105231 RepID=A0A1Y1IAB0_KLENI|nr:Ubiquitin C-terminal hydrolase [Klebsormidium nitens]|eukprot:GAQ86892.1 Ubiquitin C-terminal hydrolase [Klebsormidium nitens]